MAKLLRIIAGIGFLLIVSATSTYICLGATYEEISNEVSQLQELQEENLEIREQIHDLTEQLRDVGYYEEGEEIKNLQSLWWQFYDGYLLREGILKEQQEVLDLIDNSNALGSLSLGLFRITAYCGDHCCNGVYAGQTSTGVEPVVGVTIAVDPGVISYHTRVIIDGKEYIAQNTGGAIKGKRIDILKNSHTEAREFGVQYKEVFMLPK